MFDGTARNLDSARFRNNPVPNRVPTVMKRDQTLSDKAISLPMEALLTPTKRSDLVVRVGGP